MKVVNTSNNLENVHSFKTDYFKTKILLYLIIMHSIAFIALFNALSVILVKADQHVKIFDSD